MLVLQGVWVSQDQVRCVDVKASSEPPSFGLTIEWTQDRLTSKSCMWHVCIICIVGGRTVCMIAQISCWGAVFWHAHRWSTRTRTPRPCKSSNTHALSQKIVWWPQDFCNETNIELMKQILNSWLQGSLSFYVGARVLLRPVWQTRDCLYVSALSLLKCAVREKANERNWVWKRVDA